MARLMPLPLTVSCFSKIQIGAGTGSPGDPGNPRQSPMGRKTDVCVCLCVTGLLYFTYLQLQAVRAVISERRWPEHITPYTSAGASLASRGSKELQGHVVSVGVGNGKGNRASEKFSKALVHSLSLSSI